MKRIYFIILCGVLSLQGIANDNFVADKTLFPMLSGLCRTSVDEFWGSDEDASLNRVFTTTAIGDTVINGKHYLDFGWQRFLREENNRILLHSGKSGAGDLVLYDFNLQVGGKLPRIYTGYLEGGKQVFTNTVASDSDPSAKADTLVVTKVESITLLDGQPRKMWTFNNGMQYAVCRGCRHDRFLYLRRRLFLFNSR